MVILGEKIVTIPLKFSTNQEVRNLSSCCQPGLEVLALILPLLMLLSSMTVTGEYISKYHICSFSNVRLLCLSFLMAGSFITGTRKLTCRLRTALIELAKRKKSKFSDFVLRFGSYLFFIWYVGGFFFQLMLNASWHHSNGAVYDWGEGHWKGLQKAGPWCPSDSARTIGRAEE